MRISISRLALFTISLLALVAASVFAAPLPILDDANTVALLHMNGADTSTTFTDESGKTWTAAANAQIDTAQSVFGGASGLFDGTGDYAYSADHADWQLDGGSNANTWTADFRVRFNGDPGTGTVGLLQQYTDDSNFWAVVLANNALLFQLRVSGSNTVLSSQTFNPASATWYHIAIVKNGTAGYLTFINGTQVGSAVVDADTIPNFTGTLRAGVYSASGASNYLNGWIDELRISDVARWTTNFTPPTMEYGSLQLTQTAAANQTATAAANQTATAAANQTATAAANQTATAAANQTATVAANQTATEAANQTATVAANQTATEAANQTATAVALTLTAAPTATDTPLGGIGPAVYSGEVSYGDIARFNALACILVVLTLFLLAWIVVSFMNSRRPRQ